MTSSNTIDRTLKCGYGTRVWLGMGCALISGLLTACTVGPNYRRPEVETPTTWKIDPEYSYWHPVAPQPLNEDWWTVFGIDELDTLERTALENNQTLREAVAHYDQSRATLSSVSSEQLPQIGLSAELDRRRISANRPLTDYDSPNKSTVQNNVIAAFSASYELDLFGRIRREVESAKADMQQQANDLSNARLVITAQLAATYFALREVDAERDVLTRSIAWQQKALDFVSAQNSFGQVSELSVLQQRAQLDTTRTQARLLLTRRSQYEHAIAAMIGVPAPQFSLAPKVDPLKLPVLPIGMPSELLLRRPDVASAERAMAAANARTGVARAAYFPSLTLSPEVGWQSTRFATLTNAPSMIWSLGTSISQTLFDGGRNAAGVAYAQAGYVAANARYRATVLTAFQEVQDAVSNLAVLDAALNDVNASVDDAQQLVNLSTYRYRDGLVDYLDVITAQQLLLNSERQRARINGRQAGSLVFLAKALGGGWNDGSTVQRN
ncbi:MULTISPECIES: efflux transporter outer membrane subunit [unclassified Pseudomonas]|uniref:efflux transporter outer membrane subunit n=1 Tax=unclassified Pseudomonas TaxID=196821 RepID=UPI00215F98C0|nr:efflux transporter outer membrane subunit [Pseudomonas sp. B21-015]UVM49098.1 efflux transporter outer membrane subunit [Pseudomonas sp. B21-015]